MPFELEDPDQNPRKFIEIKCIETFGGKIELSGCS